MRLLSWFLAVSVLCVVGRPLAAQEKKAEPLLLIKGELTDQDSKDKVRTTSYCKTYEFKMEEGKTYRIDMTSLEIDPFLRLENENGGQVAFDDDSGGGPRGLDARIIYKAPKAGTYKIIT